MNAKRYPLDLGAGELIPCRNARQAVMLARLWLALVTPTALDDSEVAPPLAAEYVRRLASVQQVG